MKLHIDLEWLKAAIEREGDCEISSCSPEIAERAREIALARGHNNIDELIVCRDGSMVPVWQFYIDEAAIEKMCE